MRNRSATIKNVTFPTAAIIALFVGIGSLAASAKPLFVSYETVRPISGSGKRATDIRNLPHFSRIETNLTAEILIRTGRNQLVEISFDENLINRISTSVDNGTLTIRALAAFSSDIPCRITIDLPDLTRLDSYGEETFELDMPHEKRLSMHLDGSGNVVASGSVGELDILVTGSVNINGRELLADKVNVSLEGMSQMLLFARLEFKGDISGWGAITYFGQPSIATASISGAGSILPGRQEVMNE